MNAYVKWGLGLGAVYVLYRYYTLKAAVAGNLQGTQKDGTFFVGGYSLPTPVNNTQVDAGVREARPTREGNEARQESFDNGWSEIL